VRASLAVDPARRTVKSSLERSSENRVEHHSTGADHRSPDDEEPAVCGNAARSADEARTDHGTGTAEQCHTPIGADGHDATDQEETRGCPADRTGCRGPGVGAGRREAAGHDPQGEAGTSGGERRAHGSTSPVGQDLPAIAALTLLPLLFVEWPVASARGWALLLYLGLVPTAIAYALYTNGLRTTRVTVSGVLGLLEPLTATLLGVLFFGDLLGQVSVVGAALLLVAVLGLTARR